jgi:hypothetical protein
VAVTVEGTSQFVVDEDYRIVELALAVVCQADVSRAGATAFPPAPGRNLWEVFPKAKPLFQPYCDEARRTREPVEFLQFYSGRLFRVRAVPDGRHLVLIGESLQHLDTLTLEGLRASLDETIALIDELSRSTRHERLRDSFRLVEGGL